MQGVLDWLSALPPYALYAVLALAAALENIFPPLPADTVVAFGSFLAARGGATLAGAFIATWVGNLAGAGAMYAAGRRYGADRFEARMGGVTAAGRLQTMHQRFGLPALFLSRFIPGVRAVVPPFAGAARIPVVPAMIVMGLASGIWYGVIAYLAFHVGTNFDALKQSVTGAGRIAGITATAVILVVAVVWLIRRRNARS